MYDKFEEDHPDIKLEQVTMADDQAMSAALAAGKAPDLMLMDPSLAKERFKSGYVEPLDVYYDKYGWGDGMFGWARNAYVENITTIRCSWKTGGFSYKTDKSFGLVRFCDICTNLAFNQ
ncbi:extracellular solute-binding protein [Paenibacillus sp. UNC496MF]|nr:extracellular solute-binding protein [Paenibacillus sp. UNC496MF]